MPAIIISSKWLKTAESWFEEPKTIGDVDILSVRNCERMVADSDASEIYTIVVDLLRTEDEIFGCIKPDTRTKIRRAEAKDKVEYRYWDRDIYTPLDDFITFFNRSAAIKGIPFAPEVRLRALADKNMLDLSCTVDPDGSALVWHANLRNCKRARMLHSGSLYRESVDSAFRNLVGRANRLQHWRDIVRFRNDGLEKYDFGGWYAGSADEEQLRINQFKEGFGGSIVREYNCTRLLTTKAHIAKTTRRLFAILSK